MIARAEGLLSLLGEFLLRRKMTRITRMNTAETIEVPTPYHTIVCFENSSVTIILPLPFSNHPFAKRFMRKWSWIFTPPTRAVQLVEKASLKTNSVGPSIRRTTEYEVGSSLCTDKIVELPVLKAFNRSLGSGKP